MYSLDSDALTNASRECHEVLFEVLAGLKPAIGFECVRVREDGGVEVDESVPRGYHGLRDQTNHQQSAPFQRNSGTHSRRYGVPS